MEDRLPECVQRFPEYIMSGDVRMHTQVRMADQLELFRVAKVDDDDDGAGMWTDGSIIESRGQYKSSVYSSSKSPTATTASQVKEKKKLS